MTMTAEVPASSLDVADDLVQQAIGSGASAADAVLFHARSLSASVRRGEREMLERSESAAIGLRVFVGNSQAIVSSTDLGQETLTELVERGIAMAKVAPPDPDSMLAPKHLLAKNPPDLDLFDSHEPSAEWLYDACGEIEEAAFAVRGVTNSKGAEGHYSASHMTLVTSEGFSQHYQASHFSLSVVPLAGEGAAMERDFEYVSTCHLSDLPKPSDIGTRAGQRVVARLGARKASSCQLSVVYDPRVARQMLNSLAGAISGASVAKGTSFLKDALGTQIFSPHITIVDDPHRQRGLGSRPFDAEGVTANKMAIVSQGKLTSWLLDMRSANKLGMTTTGHASRGIASPPSPSTSNFYMENGTVSKEDLIADIKQGFYVTETFGMGVNLITGDYSQGATGFWIENGKITYPVNEVTIAGHLKTMFQSVTPANDLEFLYATNTPTLRIDGMTLAGK